MEPFHHSHIPLCTYWSSVGYPSPTAGTSYPWWICTCRRGSLQSLAAEGCVGLQSVGHYEITKTISFHILIKTNTRFTAANWKLFLSSPLHLHPVCCSHACWNELSPGSDLSPSARTSGSKSQSAVLPAPCDQQEAIMCPQRKCARQETNQVVWKEQERRKKGATWAIWFRWAWGLVFLWEQAYHFGTEVSMGQLSYKCKARRSRLPQQVLLHAFHSQQVVSQQSEKKWNTNKYLNLNLYIYIYLFVDSCILVLTITQNCLFFAFWFHISTIGCHQTTAKILICAVWCSNI